MDIKTVSEPLYNAKFWMKLVAVMMIIYGVLTALTIVGIIIAWLPIWMGIVLYQSAGLVEKAYLSTDDQAMTMALAKLKTYFTITGVLTLIGLVIGLLSVILGVGTALLGVGEFG